MTTIKAMPLAALVTAINVLVASGFAIGGNHPPALVVPAGSVPTEASVDIGPVRGGPHNPAGIVCSGGDLQTCDVCVADPGYARGRPCNCWTAE